MTQDFVPGFFVFINRFMKVILKTLVDITETQARFNPNNPEWQSQQNYITVINTIGLRSNPVITVPPNKNVEVVDGIMGSSFAGKQNVWTVEFTVDQELSTNKEFLVSDFNGVPFIPNLSESVNFQESIFATVSDKYKNIVFEVKK